MADTNETIERDYVDNFSIKEMVTDKLMPTYFPDMDTETLTAGTTGMTAEYISTITEDAFNTGSSLVAETFPSRAKMESSIYSNAAVFQLTNTFAEASEATFVIVLSEADVKANFITKPGSDYKFFYLDKNTKVVVQEKPFTLDYDIEIRAMYRASRGAWVYSAKYMMDEFTNTVSHQKDPYIKLKQIDGLIALTLKLRQYERSEPPIYESIVDNATLNYPTISVPYSGKLLGFDVLYKAPEDSDYNTQLKTKVIYSLPEKEPFCYFKPIDESTIEISFTTKDSYFQPKFNSELMILVYTTLGEEGDFDFYDGDDYSVEKGEAYEYENSWLITAKAITGAKGGKERLSTEGLQRLTVEGYSTANSISTEHDLAVYFDNYDYKYKNKILFTKKRNDAVEMLFSAFMYIKNGDYIYPTNTLVMDTNVLEFDYKPNGYYNLDPGFLFGYKKEDAFFIPVYYYPIDGTGEYYDEEGHFFDENGVADSAQDITKDRLQIKINLNLVTSSDAGYYKLPGENAGSKYVFFNEDGTVGDREALTQTEMYQKFIAGEVRYGGIEKEEKVIDFIVDKKKEAEAKLAYANFYEDYKTRENKPDLTYDEYIFDYTFKDYKNEHGIDNRINIFDTDFENFEYMEDFMFTNPFVTTITKTTGLISYFQSFISKNSELNFVKENDDDAFSQFITYHLDVSRDISKEKKYNFKIEVIPSIDEEEDNPYVTMVYDETDESQFILYEGSKPSLSNFKKELLEENRLRAILTFIDASGEEVGYMEMIPTQNMDEDHDYYVFQADMYTDDYITTGNVFRPVHICPHCGHTVVNSANANIAGKKYYCDNCGNTFREGIINIKESDSILLPIFGATVKLTMLFKDPEDDLSPVTDNEFYEYSDSYAGYIWTNVYNTQDDTVTFVKPLDFIRSTITYKDYYQTGVDALDCRINNIPLLKYSILAYKDEGMVITDPLLSDDIGKFQYFMDTFLGNYNILEEAKQYLGGLNIDAKFYNTYGKSTNYIIGNDKTEELLDTNNISISMMITIEPGFDEYECGEELRLFIKDYIEQINSEGTNDFYVSNLIREIEKTFAYVNHIVFEKINNYSTEYQSIHNESINLNALTKEERRNFVPDILVINKNNVLLTFNQATI